MISSKKLTGTFLFISMLAFYSNIMAQGFRFDDPNVTFKDANGKILTVDSAKAIVSKGSVNFSTSSADDGKLIVTLKPMAKGEAEKRKQDEQEWIAKKINTQFPNFELKNLQGKQISNGDFKGKYVVLNFWFIGCKPCVAEIPELNRLVAKYQDENVLFFSPSLDKAAPLNGFNTKHDFKYMILPDAETLSDDLGISIVSNTHYT